MLNEEQHLFVHDIEYKYRKLYGVPGGGKTLCIIEKLCVLKENELIKDYNDYLVLTFSRRACEDFIKKGYTRDKKLFHSKSIRTIHSACSSILYNSNSDEYMNISTIVHECNEFLKKDSNLLLQKEKNWFAKKIIIIDEAQDISRIQYDFICTLGKRYDCPIILVGDPNQSIFQFQNGSDKFLLEHPGEFINLKTNYRSSHNIISFLNNFRPLESYGYITTELTDSGKKPSIITGDIEECLNHLWKKIISTKESLHEIAIIAPIKLSKSYCLSLSVIANFLDQMCIPFIKHYQDSEQDTSYKKSKEPSIGKINLYTIHGSKGLEFKKVFLCNFHFKTQGYTPTKSEFLEHKYLWYVGMSRAMNELYIYGLHEHTLFPTIYTCPSYLYTSNNQIIEKPYIFKSVSCENKNYMHSVKTFITTKIVLDEDKLSELYKRFKYSVTTEYLYNVNVELYDYNAYSILYGMFIEEWVFYKTADIETYISSKKRWFDVKVPLSKYLWRYMNNDMRKVHYYSDFIKIMNHERDIDNDILKVIQKNLANRNDYFDFCIDNNVSTHDQGKYYSYLDNLKNAITSFDKISNVWNLVLYNYQLNYECKYLLKTDFTNHFITLESYIQEIDKIDSFNMNTLFQIPIIDSDIHLKGVIDCLDEDNVIHELKFCQEVSIQDYLQVFLYALIHYNDLNGKHVVLWNLQKGIKYTLSFIETNANEIRKFLKDC